ncbi:MAG TPA: transcription antitermination factor NusB [Acidimicrobiales bacterium]|nr:transcription antitermination factor NusB [Acidimicrobiales bacterium]
MSTSPGPEPSGSRPRARSGRAHAPGQHFLGGSGERRRSRERALELSYEAEQKGLLPAELLAELPVPPSDYALQLVTGLTERLDDVDELVSGHSSGWAIERMPAVDRCILRIATYELISELAVPVAVVIDEAVELAKEYSTEDSPRFINGVLAAIADTVRGEEAPASPGAPFGRGSSEGARPSPAHRPAGGRGDGYGS